MISKKKEEEKEKEKKKSLTMATDPLDQVPIDRLAHFKRVNPHGMSLDAQMRLRGSKWLFSLAFYSLSKFEEY